MAYLAEVEEKEEAGGKKIDRRQRDETDFGCKGCSQNAAFQVRIFTFFFFLSSPRRVPYVVDTGTAGKFAVSMLSWCLTLYQKNIIISFNLNFLCRGSIILMCGSSLHV